MTGSGGNACLDLLRALAPATVPAWLLVLSAAGLSAAFAIVLLRLNAVVCRWMERRVTPQLQPRRASSVASAGTLGALAAYPVAPHVFFADIDIGLFLIIALSSVATIGIVMADWTSNSERTPQDPLHEAARRIACTIPLGIALLVPVLIGGTLNLIEASRLQSDWFGMGWFVFKNPFGLAALVMFFMAALELQKHEQYVGMFLISAVAAVFFLGGFESPLTWGLRKSLGEDPGFLNHVTLADGSTQTRIAIGGLVFQLVCACTLIAKTMIGVFVMMRLRSARPQVRFERVMTLSHRYLTPLALLCVFGAGVWEWVRAVLWSGVPGP